MIRQVVIQSSTIGLPIRSSEGSGFWEMLAKKLALTIPQLRCPFSMSTGNVILYATIITEASLIGSGLIRKEGRRD